MIPIKIPKKEFLANVETEINNLIDATIKVFREVKKISPSLSLIYMTDEQELKLSMGILGMPFEVIRKNIDKLAFDIFRKTVYKRLIVVPLALIFSSSAKIELAKMNTINRELESKTYLLFDIAYFDKEGNLTKKFILHDQEENINIIIDEKARIRVLSPLPLAKILEALTETAIVFLLKLYEKVSDDQKNN